jgi:hypothetical protein
MRGLQLVLAAAAPGLALRLTAGAEIDGQQASRRHVFVHIPLFKQSPDRGPGRVYRTALLRDRLCLHHLCLDGTEKADCIPARTDQAAPFVTDMARLLQFDQSPTGTENCVSNQSK